MSNKIGDNIVYNFLPNQNYKATICGDIYNIPLSDNTFNIIHTLANTADTSQFLKPVDIGWVNPAYDYYNYFIENKKLNIKKLNKLFNLPNNDGIGIQYIRL